MFGLNAVLTPVLLLCSFASIASGAGGSPEFGDLPLLFEENEGHFDGSVRFVARAPGYDLFLARDAMVLSLGRGDAAIRTRFLGANPTPVIEGLDEAVTKIHYLIGDDRSRWSVDNRTFHRVRYTELWPGVDLVLYEKGGELEYDFVVAPGADPTRIELRYEGVDRVSVRATGELELQTPAGVVSQSAPVLHQETTGGGRQSVVGRFVLLSDREVGFAVEAYDDERPLVIDPVLVYSSLLGGNALDYPNDIGVDSTGAAIVVGKTKSSSFPVTVGALQTALSYEDAFIAKFTPTGDALLWCTFLGGDDPAYAPCCPDDQGNAVAIDATDRVLVVGRSATKNFPTTAGAIKASQALWTDAFVSILSPDGASLVYSTLLGGSLQDQAHAVDVDASGVVYVTGETDTFPVTAGAVQTSPGGFRDAFVAWFTPGSAMSYSTHLGSNGWDYGYAIEAGADGRVYVAGSTDSSSFPTTANAFQPGKSSIDDGFVARFHGGTGALEYSTFLGGDSADMSSTFAQLTTDGAGKVWVVGSSKSTNYPTTAGALLTTDPINGYHDGVLTCLDTNQAGASSMVFSTYFGGSGGPSLFCDVERDASGNAWVLGYTQAENIPTLLAWDDEGNDNSDAVLACFDPSGTLLNSTYFGGDGAEPNGTHSFQEGGIAIDGAGSLYITLTVSTNVNKLTTPGAFQTTSAGSADGFVAKFLPDDITCQQDLGFQGPGGVTLSLCGGDLSPGTWSRLQLKGVYPNSLVYFFGSSQSNPTYVWELKAQLVPLPVQLVFAVPADSAGEIDFLVPGVTGPGTLYLQAIAPNQQFPDPMRTSNAIRIDIQ